MNSYFTEHFSGKIEVTSTKPIKLIGGSGLESIQFIHRLGAIKLELELVNQGLLFKSKELEILIHGLLWDFTFESAVDRLIIYKRPAYTF